MAVFCLLLLLLLLTANGLTPGGSVIKCKTGQYNTVKYNTIGKLVVEIHLQSPVNYVRHCADFCDTLTWSKMF